MQYIKTHPDVGTAAQLFTTPANWPKEVQDANRFSLKQVQAAQAKSGKLPPWCDEAYDMIQADPDAPALLKEKSNLQLGRAFNNLRADSPDNWDDLRKARSEERIELAEYKRRLAVAAAAGAAGTSGAHGAHAGAPAGLGGWGGRQGCRLCCDAALPMPPLIPCCPLAPLHLCSAGRSRR